MEGCQSMRRLGQFLLITLVQGILFLVPIVLIAVVAREGYQMLRRAFQPVARLLPEDRVVGMLMEDLLAIAAIIVLFMIAGLFVGTRPGRLLSTRLEQAILYRVPGYLLVRGAMGSFPGLSSDCAAGARPGRDRRRLGLRPHRRAPPPGILHRLPARRPDAHERVRAHRRGLPGEAPRSVDDQSPGLPDTLRHRGRCDRREILLRDEGGCSPLGHEGQNR